MVVLTLDNVTINFPFKPYSVQVSLIEKVIQCLNEGQNGMLESPAGTGKTLGLLCSVLGWLDMVKDLQQALSPGLQNNSHPAAGSDHTSHVCRDPKIIYASHSHSHLTQVINELKKTSYSHVKVSVLGSIDKMCIHPDVCTMDSVIKVHFCHLKVNTNSCLFHSNVDAALKNAVFKDGDILDIEDLVKVGQKLKSCPYYLAKSLKDTAEIVFVPYTYLLDPKMRRSLGIELRNNVVILDEAHNVAKICEESASLQICSSDIVSAIEEVMQIIQEYAIITYSDSNTAETLAIVDFSADDLFLLKTMFVQLEKEIDEIKVDQNGSTFPGSFMLELLEKVELTPGKSFGVLTLLEKTIKYLSATNPSPYQPKGVGLQKFHDLMKIVFCGSAQNQIYMKKLMKCYKVHLTLEDVIKKDSWMQMFQNVNKNGKVINYLCFSPEFRMQSLQQQGARCIILASSTLSPLNPLIRELSIPIGVTLENPHVIQPSQICVAVLKKGPDSVTLDSSFRNRDSHEYMMSLGRTILNLSRVIPHGLLVFFPSYRVMKNCQEAWQNDGIWTKICNCKPISIEARCKDGLASAVGEYNANVMDPVMKGGCLMAVASKAASEGVHFSDVNAGAVIVAGMPFPPCMDTRVALKRAYLDELVGEGPSNLSGHSWYQLEASRAVNQAIGRVIRHGKDYGAVLLCDERFSGSSFHSQLSAWIQPHVKVLGNFGQLIRVVKNFFRIAERMLPQPETMLDVGIRDVNNRWPSSQIASTSAMSSAPDGSTDEHNSTNLHSRTLSSDESITGRFTALHTPAQVNNVNNTGAGHVVSREGRVDTCAPAANKRKRKLLSPDSGVGSWYGTTQVVRRNADPNIDPVRMAIVMKYLNEVRRLVDCPSYHKFCTALRDYAEGSSSSEACLAVLEEVFLKTFKLPSLFYGFHKFIKPEHKHSFSAFCQTLKNN